MKVLTIIIPTYNMEKYLHKCLESLIVSNENMKYLEVLVINDGSKDSSSQIGHEYESGYPQTFRVIDKENGNYGSCVNRGLKEATGKYVKVLDADDYFNTEVLDNYINFLGTTDADMILTDYNEVNEEGEITKVCKVPYPNKDIAKIVEYCEDWYFVDLQMHAVTYRRSKLIENNYTQTTGVSYTDQEWTFLPVTYMDTFSHYQGFLYQYLVGRAGQTIDKVVSTRQTDVRFFLIYKRIDYFEDALKNPILDDRKKNYLKNRLLHSCYHIYRNVLIFSETSETLIRTFDKEILDRSEYIYNEIAFSPMCKCRNIEFINYWRKHDTLPLKAKLIKIINSLTGGKLSRIRL